MWTVLFFSFWNSDLVSVQVEAWLQTHNILERKDEVTVGSQCIEKKGKMILLGWRRNHWQNGGDGGWMWWGDRRTRQVRFRSLERVVCLQMACQMTCQKNKNKICGEEMDSWKDQICEIWKLWKLYVFSWHDVSWHDINQSMLTVHVDTAFLTGWMWSGLWLRSSDWYKV